MAAFAVTADTSDTCTLMAWLAKWAAMPMGLIVHCPSDMTARLHKHVIHNVEKMIKASLVVESLEQNVVQSMHDIGLSAENPCTSS